jgi:hypothetical protein
VADRVQVLKWESTSKGGSSDEEFHDEIDTNEDGLDARAYHIQNDSSADSTVVISRDSSNNMTFADGVVSGTKTLQDLLESGEDDDQVEDNVADGEVFTVKEDHQHIIYDEFKVIGEYVVRGTSVIIGGDDETGGGGTPDPHASTHQNSGSDEISVAGLSGELADDQPPKAHALGGAKHTSATLAELNALVSDATLDSTSDTRVPVNHSTAHENGGADEISVAGLSGELADNQPPKTHASSHQSGGADSIKLDDFASPDDNTDLNATTSAHGLCPKLGGGSTNFLRADGTWSAPPGAGTIEAFSGFDDSGGTSITGSWVDVPLDAEFKKTSGFTHSTSSNEEEVTIVSAGTYQVSAEVTIDQVTPAGRSEARMRLALDGGSGYAAIAGTIAAMYSRNDSQGASTGAVSLVRDFDAGDKIKIQATQDSGGGTIILLADGSRLTIVKL